jgi:hypothetical protein
MQLELCHGSDRDVPAGMREASGGVVIFMVLGQGLHLKAFQLAQHRPGLAGAAGGLLRRRFPRLGARNSRRPPSECQQAATSRQIFSGLKRDTLLYMDGAQFSVLSQVEGTFSS